MLLSEVILELLQMYLKCGEMPVVLKTTNEFGDCKIDHIALWNGINGKGENRCQIVSKTEQTTEYD